MLKEDLIAEYSREFVVFLQWADGFLFFALILIIADLFFGVKAAEKRGEKVRKSRAIRRSVDKVCGYILWILIAFGLGEVFGDLFGVIPVPIIALGLIYFVEIESIIKNYAEWIGLRIKVNLLGFLSKKTANIIEIEDKDNKEENDNETRTKKNSKKRNLYNR